MWLASVDGAVSPVEETRIPVTDGFSEVLVSSRRALAG